MRRADRLFEIFQVLRRSTRPLTAAAIAEELETSQRTIYRDIAALISRRVPVRGEAGLGYVLERGFDLPPLTLDEIEAVVLGTQWLIANADPALARAALDVLAKVGAIVPEGLRIVVDDPVVGTPPSRARLDGTVDVAKLRSWCRQERKLSIRYVDDAGGATERTVWPFLIGYVASTRVLAAWCELRKDFRTFRIERIASVDYRTESYPEHRATLRKQRLATTGRSDRLRGDWCVTEAM